MIDHVTIGVSSVATADPLFTRLLAPLGVAEPARTSTGVRWGDLSLAHTGPARAVTHRLHVGLGAPDRAAVDAFWAAGRAAGLRSDGAPGPRPQYAPDYYGAFLLDPDGNSFEAVHYQGVRTSGLVDHLRLRVRDLAATRAFCAAIAGPAGLTVGVDTPEHLLVRSAGGGSVSFVPAAAAACTTPVHLAFSAGPDGPAAVDAFHAAALAAGAPDHGAPGPRPRYHDRYYGAFVLDPDGHNVDVVHHG